jgi:NAD(P)-dependent dehydrogenase (short-subunit alcohol dehydrogenase family)
MNFQNATVLITGANRGIGLALAREALARGARKVYAAARDPDSITLPGVVPIRLDVSRDEDVQRVAAQCGDVTVLINNAGVAETGGFLAEGAVDAARRQLEVNYFGPLRMARAFAPVLAANGGGALVNVLSIASWIGGPLLAGYAATKSAAWSLTNSLRQELAGQGTLVAGLHMGFVDTELTQGIAAPKTTPQAIATALFDGLAQGATEILGDEVTRQVKQGLSAGVYLQALSR